MSKAFKKETDAEQEELPELPIASAKNYVTPTGFAALQNELQHLVSDERPKVVEVVRWAASNGDRSENGDYIYGKRRLREIDRRIRYLMKRIKSAEIVDPQLQKNLNKVYFGATVKYAQEDGIKKTIKIVGVDEADLNNQTVSWISPLAKALLKAEIGDRVKLRTPNGVEVLEILEVRYG